VKPDQASGTLSTAVTAGANEGGWIQWIVEDPSTFHARAASEAVANARKVAEQIAAKSGVQLGRLMSVTQNQGPAMYSGPIGNMGTGGTFGMGDSVMLVGGMQVQNQQLAINSRRVEFRATVNAVFEIVEAQPTAK
jgi:hypothetical protein